MGAPGARTEDDQQTEQLVAPAVGDRCVTCDAPLATDQRYCLNCGERRGKAPFSFATLVSPPPPPAPPAAPPRRAHFSSGATLVAGIATLLLAMGVGVLIGHNGNQAPQQRASAPQVINVGGGGGAGATTASNQGSTKQAKQNAKAAAKVKAPKVVVTKKVQAQAAASAAKVLGGGAPKQPTIKTGQSCVSGQQGCQGGKFTGNFFGGG